MKIIITKNDIEKVEAFALRYSCLTEEIGDKRWVLSPHSLYIDPMDNDSSCLITAWNDNEIIGTVRMLFRNNNPFLADHFYQWEWLAENFRQDTKDIKQHTALFDRACVKVQFRRRGVYDEMLAFACNHAKENDIQFIVSGIEEKNLKAKKWADKNNFSFYPYVQKINSFSGHLVYKAI